MVIVDRPMVLNAESRVAAGKRWVWRDVGENGKDELVWELENCETGQERLVTRHRRNRHESSY